MDMSIFETDLKLHGHKCPAMPLGIRVGLAALKALHVERARNKELFCFVQTGPAHATMCFVDGVQMATGCTYGKANIQKLNYGKNAVTLIDVRSKRQVRVSTQPELQKRGLTSEFVKLRRKGVEPWEIPAEITDPIVERIVTLPDEEIVVVGKVKETDWTPGKGTFEWDVCEKCGEVTFASGLRVAERAVVCIPCSGCRA